MSCCEDRRDALVAYLYGELAGREREELLEHVATCDGCEAEFAELAAASTAVQTARAAEEPWAVAGHDPGHAGYAARAFGGHAGSGRSFTDTVRGWWNGAITVPRWAFAGGFAGVALLLLIAAGLDIDRTAQGVTVSWGDATPGVVPSASGTAPASGTELASGAGPATRSEPATTAAAGTSRPGSATASDPVLLSEVARMLEESESRQKAATAELVVLMGEKYQKDIEESRRQDLQLVDYWIGNLSGRTQMEFVRTNQQLSDMARLIMDTRGTGTWPGSRGVPGVREGRLEPGSGPSEAAPDSVAPGDSAGVPAGGGSMEWTTELGWK